MAAPILPLTSIAAAAAISAPALAPTSTGSGPAFASILADAVNKVELFQQNAQQSIDRFLSGEGDDLHKVALASQQADLSFQLFLQVRNKVVSAYQEIMKMQV
jgi:flagellar hook-basal body complex protein FliE